MGIGLAALERHIYDPQNGLPGNIGLLQAKPASYLDVPRDDARRRAVDIADPQNPVGAKGIGEPVQGCAAAGAALRDLRCARRPLLQPHAGDAGHDRQRGGQARRSRTSRLQVNTA